MKIIVVDDEELALKYLKKKIKKIKPESEIIAFCNPNEAYQYMKNNNVHIAFLDIEMYGISGIELAKKLKELHKDICIIFVTGFSQYAVEAFEIHASGYLLKPPTEEAIKRELDFACKSLNIIDNDVHIRIQTFGGFEVFVDGVQVQFNRAKSKELLAYLVDRKGAGATTAELAAVLWEDREYDRATKNYFQTIVVDMISSLKNVNADKIILKKRNNISVDINKFECDYYNFLKGDIRAINTYKGDYMIAYSWAELTMGLLNRKFE